MFTKSFSYKKGVTSMFKLIIGNFVVETILVSENDPNLCCYRTQILDLAEDFGGTIVNNEFIKFPTKKISYTFMSKIPYLYNN